MQINPKVIDIYHLNANNARGGDGADFHAVHAAGFRGVIHKASQGTHIPDTLYAASSRWRSRTPTPKCASTGRTIRAAPAA
jgi:hypothetical protein